MNIVCSVRNVYPRFMVSFVCRHYQLTIRNHPNLLSHRSVASSGTLSRMTRTLRRRKLADMVQAAAGVPPQVNHYNTYIFDNSAVNTTNIQTNYETTSTEANPGPFLDAIADLKEHIDQM